MKPLSTITLGALFALGALFFPEAAGADPGLPAMLRGVGVEQELDATVSRDLGFRDETGAPVKLGNYFGARPILLTLNYFHCPMLCPMAFDGIVRSIRGLGDFQLGRELEIVTVSIDPRETPAQAAERKAKTAAELRGRGVEAGWHFLTGDAATIARLAATVGFRYQRDDEHDQFAHAAAVVFLTPDGRVSRNLYAIDLAPRDVRLAVVEASEGKVGTLADQILLFCYHYDLTLSKYGPMVLAAVRIAGIATLLVLGIAVGRMLLQEGTKSRV